MNFYQKRADALAEQIEALKAEAEGVATRAEAEERDLTDEEKATADAKLAEAVELRKQYDDATTRAAELADLETVGGEGLRGRSEDLLRRHHQVVRLG